MSNHVVDISVPHVYTLPKAQQPYSTAQKSLHKGNEVLAAIASPKEQMQFRLTLFRIGAQPGMHMLLILKQTTEQTCAHHLVANVGWLGHGVGRGEGMTQEALSWGMVLKIQHLTGILIMRQPYLFLVHKLIADNYTTALLV
jgi:hypothetical protein